MRTTKPIATISYNTPQYLKLKLDELLKSKVISFWAFIRHKPEDDEGGKKYHNHVYVEPAKMLQTVELCEALKEFDPVTPDKFLGCINFRFSKFDDWYLYGLHDRAYLAWKQQSRRHTYDASEMVCSDRDELNYLVRNINLLEVSRYADMLNAQRQGVTWNEYFSRGTVPIPQVRAFEYAWNLLVDEKLDRNGRPGHEFEVDDVTGEVRGVFDDEH